MTNETYVLLWSQSQCALHIESVKDMLQENARAFANDRRMDYVPLAFGTQDECHANAERIRGTLHVRQEARAGSQA